MGVGGVMGAWACRACAQRLSLADGYATAARGHCQPGGHDVKDEIRWYEDVVCVVVHPQIASDLIAAKPRGACEARLRYDSAGEAAMPLAVTPEGQLDMFGPNREPLRGRS